MDSIPDPDMDIEMENGVKDEIADRSDVGLIGSTWEQVAADLDDQEMREESPVPSRRPPDDQHHIAIDNSSGFNRSPRKSHRYSSGRSEERGSIEREREQKASDQPKTSPLALLYPGNPPPLLQSPTHTHTHTYTLTPISADRILNPTSITLPRDEVDQQTSDTIPLGNPIPKTHHPHNLTPEEQVALSALPLLSLLEQRESIDKEQYENQPLSDLPTPSASSSFTRSKEENNNKPYTLIGTSPNHNLNYQGKGNETASLLNNNNSNPISCLDHPPEEEVVNNASAPSPSPSLSTPRLTLQKSIVTPIPSPIPIIRRPPPSQGDYYPSSHKDSSIREGSIVSRPPSSASTHSHAFSPYPTRNSLSLNHRPSTPRNLSALSSFSLTPSSSQNQPRNRSHSPSVIDLGTGLLSAVSTTSTTPWWLNMTPTTTSHQHHPPPPPSTPPSTYKHLQTPHSSGGSSSNSRINSPGMSLARKRRAPAWPSPRLDLANNGTNGGGAGLIAGVATRDLSTLHTPAALKVPPTAQYSPAFFRSGYAVPAGGSLKSPITIPSSVANTLQEGRKSLDMSPGIGATGRVRVSGIPPDYVIKQLNSLAEKFWFDPNSADCTVLVPVPRRPLANNTQNENMNDVPSSSTSVHSNQPGSSFWPPTPVAPDLEAAVTAAGPAGGLDGLGQNVISNHKVRRGRRGSLPEDQAVPVLVFPLHKDYLITQSSLFRALLSASPLAHVDFPAGNPRGAALTGGLTAGLSGNGNFAASQRVALQRKGARILPGTQGEGATVFVPIPDPESFGVIVHWLYWGDVDALESALNKGMVTWQGVVKNIDYLGLDDNVKKVMGKWWRKWIKTGRSISTGDQVDYRGVGMSSGTNTATAWKRKAVGGGGGLEDWDDDDDESNLSEDTDEDQEDLDQDFEFTSTDEDGMVVPASPTPGSSSKMLVSGSDDGGVSGLLKDAL